LEGVAVPVEEEEVVVVVVAMILTRDHLLPTVAGGIVISLTEDGLLKVGPLGSGLVLSEARLLDTEWDDDAQVVDRLSGRLGGLVGSMRAKEVRGVAHHHGSQAHPAVLDLDRQNADSGCQL
jgi:hypothetical protein